MNLKLTAILAGALLLSGSPTRGQQATQAMSSCAAIDSACATATTGNVAPVWAWTPWNITKIVPLEPSERAQQEGAEAAVEAAEKALTKAHADEAAVRSSLIKSHGLTPDRAEIADGYIVVYRQ